MLTTKKEEFFNWLIQFLTNCSFIKEFIDNNPEKYDEVLSSATSKAEADADLYVAAFGYFLDLFKKVNDWCEKSGFKRNERIKKELILNNYFENAAWIK